MTKSVSYSRGPHKIRVNVPDEWLSDECEACGYEYKEKGYSRLNTHHWLYKWKFPEVKKDKRKVLDNAVRVCVNHHRVANAIKEITDYIQRGHITEEETLNLIKSMPEDMRRVWIKLGDMIEGEGTFL